MSLRQFLFLAVVAFFISGCSSSNSSATDRPSPAADGSGGDGGADGGGDGSGGDGSGGDGSGGDGSGGDGSGGDGSGGTGSGGSTAAPEDVSGDWFSRTEVNAVNCGIGEFIDAQAFVITQDDVNISVLASSGDTFTGTVNGDIVEWSGSYDERGGTTTITDLSLVVSGDSVSGNASWTWTDGTDSCNGTMTFSAMRGTAVAESDSNSRVPDVVDTVTLVDGVAFYSGWVSRVDHDYFALTPATDVTLRVELSHFDTSTDYLNLEVVDADENQLAVSDSVDGFEQIEIALTAGTTYYIGVVPVVESETPIEYLLSIDVN